MTGLVYGMEPLHRIRAGWYETEDQEYAIVRTGQDWRLSSGPTVATCDTKLSCECVLARLRAFKAGTIDWDTYQAEIKPWTRGTAKEQ